jgi:hypothetical protein
MNSRANITLSPPRVVMGLFLLSPIFGGCAMDRMMPMAMMPTPPKECQQVMSFEVKPLPEGKSTATALSVAMAKEGAARQQEHAVSKVCAEYALRTAGVMKDKEAPAEAKKGVDGATSGTPATSPTVKKSPAKKTNPPTPTPPPAVSTETPAASG